jgi:ParB family transcriptional regulator, chromosome partitioning protein
MRIPWSKSKAEQLELLDDEHAAPRDTDRQPAPHDRAVRSITSSTRAAANHDGRPLLVPLNRVDEDPNNPRTEFTDAEIDELAEDIRQHGILQPLVVHPADAAGRYRIHFGAMRYRAARRAGLDEVPVVFRHAPADPYAQVAENQRRHGLTPLDLARFIRTQAVEGQSNATLAKRLGMDLTTIAHYLALLDLPPALDDALKSGRCTSPRTLYELSKLHQAQPEQVKTLIAGGSEITRAAVAAVRSEHPPVAPAVRSKRGAPSLLIQANGQCARLEQTLIRIKHVEKELVAADLDALRQRVATLMNRLA